MSTDRGFKATEVIKAIRNSGGIITTISKRLKCNWTTAKVYVNKWKSTKQAYQEEQENMLDMSETTIYGSIQNGDVHSAKWLLAMKGKERGYSERIEVKDAKLDRIVQGLDKIRMPSTEEPQTEKP